MSADPCEEWSADPREDTSGARPGARGRGATEKTSGARPGARGRGERGEAADRVDADLLARIALAKVCEPEHKVVAPLAVEVGVQEAWERVRRNADGRFTSAAARVAALDLDRELYVAERQGLRLVVPGSPEWPAGFDDLALPPWCVWVRGSGNLRSMCAQSVAVVGARAATAYGTSVARTMARDLAEMGFSIVSGAAFGIDAAAHQGALAAGAGTIAVLASGADRPYPSAHTELINVIAQTGAVVSECPPGAAPLRKRFLSRNRLIAAMTSGTVVVEAGLRSGSLNTATHAQDLLRHLGAVPGPVTSAASAGSNNLIRERKAELVTDAEEVAELVGPTGQFLLEPKRGPDRPEDSLRGAERQVYDALPTRRACGVDRLVVSAGLSVHEVLSALAGLEVNGLAFRRDGCWRRA